MSDQSNHWLVKSEPAKYSFSDLERDGKTVWDGVRNATAARNLREMKKGDQVFYYHSQEGLEIVGVAEVTREHFADPSDPSGRFVAVELKPVRQLPKPVTLAQIKATPALKDMALVRIGRLSVSQVTPEQWRTILAMGGS
jgi:predicted RNA-binding protein with PUA-like domain